MVWLATRLYDAYKEGGVDAVVFELGKQIAIQIAGGAVMKGVIAGARALLMSPTSKKIFGKMMDLIDDTPFAKEALGQGKALAGKALDQGAKLMNKFDQSKLGKFLNMLDAKLTEFSTYTAEQLKNLYLTPVLQGAAQAGGKIAAKGAAKAEGHVGQELAEGGVMHDVALLEGRGVERIPLLDMWADRYGKRQAGHVRTNEELIQDIATKAHKFAQKWGAVAGTRRHKMAEYILNRYQIKFGHRGLQAEVWYKNGAPLRKGESKEGAICIDVLDFANGVVYDYKFVMNPGKGLGRQQIKNYNEHLPEGFRVIEVNPVL